MLSGVVQDSTGTYTEPGGWTAKDVQDWHTASGYDVAYITDHRTFQGAIEGTQLDSAMVGQALATTILPGIEVFWDRAPRSTASDDDPAWSQLPTTGRDLVLTENELSSRIRCRERATNSNGSSDSPSNSVRVDAGPPTVLAFPTVTGMPRRRCPRLPH